MIKPNEISDILKQQLEEVDTKIDFEVLYLKWAMVSLMCSGWIMFVPAS